MAKRKPKKVSVLKKKAWPIFARLVKLSSADDQGYCYCYTCNKKMMWNDRQCHAGHYRTRGHNSTLYHRENVKPQCSYCNRFEGGEQHKFGIRLDEEYGEGKADELTILSHKTKQFTVEELEELMEEWKQELRSLGYVF